MALDSVVNRLYGSDTELSSIPKRVLIPGGIIYQIGRILKQEEAKYGPNFPRRSVAMTSAVVTDFVKTAGYVAVAVLFTYAAMH